jgi:CMP-N-acetylneuraminic acid synthetase/spore coat polysaccharide biosynthesis predicted glycosyltransferase SpsG
MEYEGCDSSMNILAVIPARGGSKGIPRKNIRFMCGKPLIAYAIENALKCPLITACVVTTDDPEIAYVAKQFGSDVVPRGKGLAADSVTLDPVVEDAVIRMEAQTNSKYEFVITMQPTSPLLQVDTLNQAIQTFINKQYDTLISVVNHPHLSWTKKDGKIVPNYEKRLNRQQLPPSYMETGAFLITRRECVTKTSRIGKNISVFEVPESESIDIDTVGDWVVSESQLRKKRIIFRVDGTKKIGMGHIYNCLTMAFSFTEHQVLFVTRKDCIEGLKKIQSTNLPYVVIENKSDLSNIISSYKPDIWVNDCLNTSAEYIQWLKKYVKRVITIEDLGEGTKYADAVINALYEYHHPITDNLYEGARYVCLRDEFKLVKQKEFSSIVNNVLVMFGGTDPSNLNYKLYQVAKAITSDYPNIEFHFIIGIGYDADANGIFTNLESNIFVHKNVSRVTEYMKKADLAISSQGRTVYEIASMGIPSIILSQNEREAMHTFATMKNGFINLGLGKDIDVEAIANTVKWLIDTANIRKNMRALMIKHNFDDGIQHVKDIILGDETK